MPLSIGVVVGFAKAIMIDNLVWVGLMVCRLAILFIVNIYTGTYYKITVCHQLLNNCGVMESFDIKVCEIKWIRKTREYP